MSNIVLDETQLGRLWDKMLNTFELRGGYSNATVIWANSSPTSEFSAKTISSLPNLSAFRYFIFEWKESSTDAGTKQEVYINNFYQSTPTSALAIDRYGYIYTSGNRCFRYFQRVANSNTSLYFADCYNIVGASSSSVSNADCIPVRILGCNTLKPSLVPDGLDAYPVGSLYMSLNNISPASFLGGSWTQGDNHYLAWTQKIPVYTDDSIAVSGSHTSVKFKNTDGSFQPTSTSYRLGIFQGKELVVFNETMTGATRSGVYPYNLMAYIGGHGRTVYIWTRIA